MGVSSNPTNTNLAQASKFLLSFSRLPSMQYFCTKVNLPGITFGEATQQTPLIDAPIPGDKMVYDAFEIDFLIDEALLSWTTIQDWIRGMAFPENTDQYKNLNMQQQLQLRNQQPQYSDASLTILTNKNNPIVTVQFSQLFPISINSLQFDTAQDATNILTGSASFKFTNYDISR
jgi:hypothetical protein